MSKTQTADKKKVAAQPGNVIGFTIFGKKFQISREEQVSSALLIVLLMVVYSIRSNFLLMPFERDEGFYSYIGTLVIDGKIPYKDFFEVKFPGLFYFYGLMVSLFGDTVKGMHTGFMYLNMLTIVIIYFASRNLFTPIAGIISAITFAVVSLTPNLSGFTVQAEHAVALFISLAILVYSVARKTKKWYWYFMMGLALGCAIMVKTSAIFLCLWGGVVIIVDFLFTRPLKIKDLLVNGFSYTIGGAVVIGTIFLVIYSQGAFNDMIYCAVEAPRKYISGMPYEEGVKYFKYTRDSIVLNYKFFWVHAILAAGVFLVRSIDLKMVFFGITLMAASFLTIVPGYFFYGHYWIQMLPGLSIAAGLTCFGIISLLERSIKTGKFNLRYVYLVIFSMVTINHVMNQKSYYFHPNYDLILRQVYGSNPFPEAMEIGNFINANSKPEDKIVLIGSEPQIYFYTKKRCPSRFAYFTGLVTNTDQAKDGQREFVKDVEAAKPRYLIFFNHPISLLVQPDADRYVFEWANKYITEGYDLVGCVEMKDGFASTYAWKEQLVNFKPDSQNQIYIYERKKANS